MWIFSRDTEIFQQFCQAVKLQSRTIPLWVSPLMCLSVLFRKCVHQQFWTSKWFILTLPSELGHLWDTGSKSSLLLQSKITVLCKDLAIPRYITVYCSIPLYLLPIVSFPWSSIVPPSSSMIILSSSSLTSHDPLLSMGI